MSEYHVGGPRGQDGKFEEWPEDRAHGIFSGVIKEKYDLGLPVIMGPPDAPAAHMLLQEQGRVVKVSFFNEDGFAALTYLFLSEESDLQGRLDGLPWPRPEQMLLTNVRRITYSGEFNKVGRPLPSESLQRVNRSDGTTSAGYDRALAGKQYHGSEWFGESTFDIESDDYWEPVATFGDWARWFRDRPDVKLFD